MASFHLIKYVTDKGDFIANCDFKTFFEVDTHLYLECLEIQVGDKLAMEKELLFKDGEFPFFGDTDTFTVTILEVTEPTPLERSSFISNHIFNSEPMEKPSMAPNIDAVIAALEERITDLSTRVTTLEGTLTATNEALLNIQRNIVELTADHIQRIFNDDVMVDSIAHRIMVAGANAISHKAKQSKERAPELVVVEGYVPGSIRVRLSEDGSVTIHEQLADTQEWVTGEQLSEGLQSEAIAKVFGDLLLSYSAELNRDYYVVDSVVLENFRTEVANTAKKVVDGVQNESLQYEYQCTNTITGETWIGTSRGSEYITVKTEDALESIHIAMLKVGDVLPGPDGDSVVDSIHTREL